MNRLYIAVIVRDLFNIAISSDNARHCIGLYTRHRPILKFRNLNNVSGRIIFYLWNISNDRSDDWGKPEATLKVSTTCLTNPVHLRIRATGNQTNE